MGRRLRVLLGKRYDSNDTFLEDFINYFKSNAIEIEVIQRSGKYGILNLLKVDREFHAIVIEENLQKDVPVGVDFLMEIKEKVTETKLIFIVSDQHHNDKEYLQRLYSKKIYNVIFQKDVNFKNISNLILNDEQPQIAKSYLGLDNNTEGELKEEKLQEILQYLNSYKNEKDLHDRYNLISKKFSKEKKIYILSKLSTDMRSKLRGNSLVDKYNEKLDKSRENQKEVKVKNKVVTKERIIKKEVVKRVYDIPRDYKKVIAVFGFESSGVTTVSANLAYIFSKNKVKTTLIDTDVQKKDIYYHFPNEYVGCMGLLDEIEDYQEIGQSINDQLVVYSEHRDKEVTLKEDNILRLISLAKKNSDIVVVDLSSNLDKEIINSVLNYCDNILFTTTQNINSLYRIGDKIYEYKDKLDSIELLINKYVKGIRYLDEKNIAKNFFTGIKKEKKCFDFKINQIFTITDDAKSVLQGLALEIPTVKVGESKFRGDIEKIADYYYKKKKKKSGIFRSLFKRNQIKKES